MAVPRSTDSKVCSCCHESKPLDAFSKAETGRFGVRGDCKACRKLHRIKREIVADRPKEFCCTSCGKTKTYDTENFKIKRQARYGLATECKECSKARNAAHYQQNKPRYQEQHNNYRVRKLSAGGSYSHTDVSRIIALQRKTCIYCRKPLTKYHVDHIHPLSKGGSNDYKNIQILCPSCNFKKSAKHPVQFAQESGFLL